MVRSSCCLCEVHTEVTADTHFVSSERYSALLNLRSDPFWFVWCKCRLDISKREYERPACSRSLTQHLWDPTSFTGMKPCPCGGVFKPLSDTIGRTSRLLERTRGVARRAGAHLVILTRASSAYQGCGTRPRVTFHRGYPHGYPKLS